MHVEHRNLVGVSFEDYVEMDDEIIISEIISAAEIVQKSIYVEQLPTANSAP